MPGWQVNFARHLQDSTCTELAEYRSDHECRHVAILCWEAAVLDAMSWDNIRMGMASVVVCDGGVVAERAPRRLCAVDHIWTTQ